MRKLEQKFLEMEELPEDPLHPIYYHVFASTLPYEFHYRIVPEGKCFCWTGDLGRYLPIEVCFPIFLEILLIMLLFSKIEKDLRANSIAQVK